MTERRFLNPEAVSKHLYCSICQDVFNEPQRAPCGHSFCKMCIEQWLKQSKTCPEDRKPVTMKQLHYDFILANIIGDQMVACPFRSRGCEFVEKLEKLSSHRKCCTFNPVNLPAFMRETEETRALNIDLNVSDTEKLPTPAKPSLKMRLFCDENKRDLLRSVFESRENVPSTTSKSEETFNNVWLEKTKHSKAGNKRIRVLSIDDSF